MVSGEVSGAGKNRKVGTRYSDAGCRDEGLSFGLEGEFGWRAVAVGFWRDRRVWDTEAYEGVLSRLWILLREFFGYGVGFT